MVRHHPAKFGGHRYRGSGDITEITEKTCEFVQK